MSKKAQIIWIRKLISVSLLVGFIFICSELFFDQGAEKNHTTVRISDFTNQKTKQISLQKIAPLPVVKKTTSFGEWCQMDYKDLSNSPVFKEFQVWLEDFEGFDCDLTDDCVDHDSRKVREFLIQGQKIAVRRSKILQKIIRGDPKTALQLAIPYKRSIRLPSLLKNHVEKWESEFVDIQTSHVCFDPNHPGGFIKRTATMQDGRKMRAWVYGKRKNLPTIKKLSIWGISFNGDIAISDQPLQIFSEPQEKHFHFGGEKYTYSNLDELSLFKENLNSAERRAFLHRIPVAYPRLAGSDGLTDYYERKYDFVSNPSSWSEAKKIAEDSNGTLVVIKTRLENRFIKNLLDQDQENFPGYDDQNNTVDLVWLGASDFEDENSTIYDVESNSSRLIELNATEGDWKWLDGTDVSADTFINWLNGSEPNATSIPSQDYAAMDWSTSEGSWIDVNASYRLPFVIEYQLENEPTPLVTPIDGYKKVLIVPARFQDEGFTYDGSSTPLVDEFGQPIYEEIQQDAYEPVSQENLARAMKEVKDFYLKNSDGTFILDAVITPTVTIPFDKYFAYYGGGEPNLYDSSGNFLGRGLITYSDEEMEFAYNAVEIVALMDESWDWDGPAFQGVVNVSVVSIPNAEAFPTPPEISFSGGNEDPMDGNRVRQRFSPANAKAVTDGEGKIIGIKILDSGSYYFSTPTILVNGEVHPDYTFDISVENTCVSWVGITTNNQSGAAGVGFVGAPGSHVDANNGNVSATTIVHELGHNFGLLHANRLVTKSERPNSDESEKIDYGNPYSVMGTSSISNGLGDLTIAEKVITKLAGNFGLTYGNVQGVDVAHILTVEEWTNSPYRMGASEGLPENTFRIYRHDYGDGPLSLKTESFPVFIPSSTLESTLLELDKNYSLSFLGTGDGASGKFRLISGISEGPNAQLTIEQPGIGFASEPKVLVLDENNVSLLSLDASWIQRQDGAGPSYSQVQLRDDGFSSNRGIRGLHLKASDFSSFGMDYEDENLNAFWLSYRRSARYRQEEVGKYGLSVLSGNTGNPENFLIDINVNTPGDFSDAFLLLGHTFSDYDSDVHITPFRHGGIHPMEYLEVVVNKGTVESGLSSAPEFSVEVSNQFPAIGEYIQITAQVLDNNASNYAYSWFTDETMETDPEFLNKSSILKSFSRSGQFVIRVVVSDLKGGVSSRNIVLQVGDYEKSSLSSISGTVRANQGLIEGARVAIAPATIVEHTVGITGSISDSQIPSGINSPASFLIDGVSSPTLRFQRGEIHRFYFDQSTEGYPLTFLDHPEHEMPRVRMNMLVTPIVDIVGKRYSEPPIIFVDEISSFATYFSDLKGTAKVGTINEYYLGHLEESSTQPLYITRPFAKSLLTDTEVKNIFIRPTEFDIDGNYVKFGGKGHDRNNPPEVYIYRSSLWEDYRNDDNASAKAYVDGVGTISPVTSLDFYSTIWETRASSDPFPELVVWGSGGNSDRPYINQSEEQFSADSNESHAEVGIYVDTDNRNIPYRTIEIYDQGIKFEPDSTMAVLQYPLDPLAYWTFDRHETLFEENSGGRYQPNPGWNALQKGSTDIFPHDSRLSGYWSFDEESGNSISSYKGSGITLPFDLSDANRSHWGVKGRAVALTGTDNVTIGNVGSTGSFSMWVKPEGNFTFLLDDCNVSYNHATRTCTFDDAVPITRQTSTYEWMHVAVVGDTNTTLYVDGMKSSASTQKSLGSLNTINFIGLLDETHIFSYALTEAQVKILAGRTFLDLSGNKIHATPVGPDFNMSSPDTDPGLSSDRPSVSNHANSKGAKSPSFGHKLGDSYLGEDHGRSLVFDDNDSYLDISPHAFYFAGQDLGSISFWVKTLGQDSNGGQVDQNIFTASCLEDNASYMRIMIRDTGVMQYHVVNDSTEVAKFRTESSSASRVNSGDWHHVVLVADGESSAFWVDGRRIASKPYEDNGDKNAFFSDVENLDFVAIGSSFFNPDNNNTENFLGNLDDFYVYDRALTSAEINYLYDLRKGREQIPRLEAVVDAVGTIEITNTGEGYKETPEVVLSYGQDGNDTSALTSVADSTALQAIVSPVDGELVYVEDEAKVYSYHQVRQENDWRHDGVNDGWVEYLLAYGLAFLNNEGTNDEGNPRGSVDRILWTKDMGKLVSMSLPDGRVVNRKFLEYVVKGEGIFGSAVGDFGAPDGLFGYTAPPNLLVDEPEPSEDGSEENATAHALFFADLNHTAEIKNPGMGLVSTGFEADETIRISGKGYRPDQWEIIRSDDLLSFTDYDLVRTSYAEYWGQDKDDNYTFEPTVRFNDSLNWGRLTGHNEPSATLIALPEGTAIDTFLYRVDESFIPKAIFSDWDHQPDIGEPRNIDLDFNQTMSHVSLKHSGFGYSMPAEIRLIGGIPPSVTYQNWVGLGNTNTYNFVPAEFEIGAVDENGTILNIQQITAGSGYLEAPTVVISGGGGVGAVAEAVLDEFGGVARIDVEYGGRGYFNIDSLNRPTAHIAHDLAEPLIGAESDASLSVRLGGNLHEIGRCTACASGDHAHKGNSSSDKFYHHLDPWVEIWDRNRTEEEIDENGDRALASVKVRNGVIEKVVVIKSGRGYIDPIVKVRGIPPHHNHYTAMKLHKDHGVWGSGKSRIPSEKVTRIWRCVNPREDKVGNLVECGHIFEGQYPPEQCPGEVDEDFPIGEASSEQAVSDWLTRHIPPGNQNHPHKHCNAYNYDNSKHLSANFRSRRCGGTKVNFVLLNDLYRTPYESWEVFDANLTALVEGGRIIEIAVLNGGSMYASTEVFTEGSGTDVDAIPIYDERGENVRVIYDDPRLKNLEVDFKVTVSSFLKLKQGENDRVVLDYDIFFPDGAGQGFQERPWSWDWIGSNNPTYGPREKVLARLVKSEEVPDTFTEDAINWSYTAPQLQNNLGDRILDIRVDNVGIFDSNRTIDEIIINFDSSHLPDIDQDGQVDFVAAVATPHTTFSLTGFRLDEDGIYSHGNRNRSLFVEEPEVVILPQASSISPETASGFLRLNGLVDYDSINERSYIDLHIDDQFPSKLYYAFGSNADGLPAMGGEIIVNEGMPGISWGQNEPQERKITAFTDQNGYYFIPNLEPGLYNVGVFLEDRKFQDSTFRPDTNVSRVSEILYVPGFPDLFLETDSRGAGVSRLVWASESRKLSRTNLSLASEINYELKVLEGIGKGFRQGEKPELIILPDPLNSNDILPNITTEVLIDGSLKLEIIDDENTTAYNPDDRFTIRYSSSVQGVNFSEYFQFSESGKSNWGGYGDSSSRGSAWMDIFPNDANGLGILEVPLETNQTGNNPYEFEIKAYEADGTQIDTSGAQWSLVLSFDPPEQNQSLVAELNQTTGSATSLSLTSTLRSSGIVDFEILSAGTDYLGGSQSDIVISGEPRGFEGTVLVNGDGNITGVQIETSGSGYSPNDRVSITDPTGNSARLSPVLGGTLYLDANLTTPSGELLQARVQVFASTRNNLSEDEKWLDRYFDSIQERNSTWWASDLDNDNLSNSEEKVYGTHPLRSDTDGDSLTDDLEISNQTNPHQSDTDGDGLTDYNETIGDPYAVDGSTGTDPRKFDTDRDGMSDGFEVINASSISELNPVISNTLGKTLGGYVFNLNEYVGDLYIKVKPVSTGGECSVSEEFDTPWQSLSGTFPMLYSFENLPMGYTYQVSVFIDTYPTGSPNGSYDQGEPSACWKGELLANTFSANLFLQEAPPEIYFADTNHEVITLPDPNSGTFTFPLSVSAWDLLDGEWDLNSTSPSLEISNQSLGEFLTLDIPNLIAEVNQSTPLGTYSITYQATDSSGSQSEALIQTIVISDTEGPVLDLLGENPYPFPYGSTWEDPGWLVSDNRDENDSITVSVSDSPNTGVIGIYTINYTATDSAGNPTNQVRTVQIVDTIAPSISVGETTILTSKGQDYVLPEYTAFDNLDGDLTADVELSGLSEVNIDAVGDYQIIFSVTDTSGNQAQLALTVRVEPPAYSLNGTAIDGYLVGAKVIFDVDGDGISDLSSDSYTQENGEFSLSFTEEEILQFDLNSNGVLDSNEGRIMVSGGVDSSTGESFSGVLLSDPNASVVTPITSLMVGLMDSGMEKTTAEQTLSSTFGLSQDLDLTSYDPYENSAMGEEASSDVLIAGARIATLMKQTEAFIHSLKGDSYESGEASAELISVLAQKITEQNVNPLDSGVEEILNQVISTEVSNNLYTTEEVADFVEIVQISDSLHKTLKDSNISPAEVAAEVAKQQLAVKQDVLDVLEDISSGSGTIQSISSTLTLESLQASTQNFLEVNLFAPNANDFIYVFDGDGFSSNQEFYSLGAVDLDGDEITYSILSGNLDSDEDGISFLQINSSGSLVLQDPDEIENLISQKVNLSISLSDSNGKSKTVLGTIKIDNALVMESESTSTESWMSSSWFGSFHKTGGPWIYHQKLGWQYVYKLPSGGYWFWDKIGGFWWWSSAESFPYAFDYSSNDWIYFNLDSAPLNLYDFKIGGWRNR